MPPNGFLKDVILLLFGKKEKLSPRLTYLRITRTNIAFWSFSNREDILKRSQGRAKERQWGGRKRQKPKGATSELCPERGRLPCSQGSPIRAEPRGLATPCHLLRLRARHSLQPSLPARKRRRAGAHSSQQPFKAGTPGSTRLEGFPEQFSVCPAEGATAPTGGRSRAALHLRGEARSPLRLLAGALQKPAPSLPPQQSVQRTFNYPFSLLSSE